MVAFCETGQYSYEIVVVGDRILEDGSLSLYRAVEIEPPGVVLNRVRLEVLEGGSLLVSGRRNDSGPCLGVTPLGP